MKYPIRPTRPTMQEIREQERRTRLKEIQNIMGLLMIGVGIVSMFFMHDATCSLVFGILGTYTIVTDEIVLPYKEV